jgi:energy-coupling factor transporter ATP-binding protein EcfA2
VADCFQRVIVMRDGQVILDGTPDKVFAGANWALLASTYLEPPLPARVGAKLGLGSTPTDARLIEQLAGQSH